MSTHTLIDNENACDSNDELERNDVILIVGEPPKMLNECAYLLEKESSNIECEAKQEKDLNLSPYRLMGGQLTHFQGVPDVPANDFQECINLRSTSNKYQKLIDNILNVGKEINDTCNTKPKNTKKRSNTSLWTMTSNCTTTCASQGISSSCSLQRVAGAFTDKKLVNISTTGSHPNILQTVHEMPIVCPVCKENKSYLPKMAACPKCGYKPVPYIVEKPYDNELTAEQILNEYLDKKDNELKEAPPQPECKKECRCQCTRWKICANCRTRKLCEDILPPRKKDDKLECKSEESEAIEICDLSSTNSRPYLARVFSELKDLYGIKRSKRKKKQIHSKCEQHLRIASNSVGNRRNITAKPTQPTVQPTQTTVKSEYLNRQILRERRNCKSRHYMYKPIHVMPKGPSIQIGDKTCINGYVPHRNVPHNMGWLWNIETNGNRRGWKPGAIRKPIKEMMKYFLKDFPADTIRVSRYAYRNPLKNDNTTEPLVQKPTLHICKKNDVYIITLRPLKDAAALKECADPYLNMKPIQFKITKNPVLAEVRKLKRDLKDFGFAKCTCHEPITQCTCRSYLDKKRLEYQVNMECCKRGLPCNSDNIILSDTSESETEFDFGISPPAGLIKPERLFKPNLVHQYTQYLETDWNTPSKFPKPLNKFIKLADCALGDRKVRKRKVKKTKKT